MYIYVCDKELINLKTHILVFDVGLSAFIY